MKNSSAFFSPATSAIEMLESIFLITEESYLVVLILKVNIMLMVCVGVPVIIVRMV